MKNQYQHLKNNYVKDYLSYNKNLNGFFMEKLVPVKQIQNTLDKKIMQIRYVQYHIQDQSYTKNVYERGVTFGSTGSLRRFK